MPIAEAVQGVLAEKIAPGEAADRLMPRQLRPEKK
jgi:glycerol-3-phosphate dehydrogenase